MGPPSISSFYNPSLLSMRAEAMVKGYDGWGLPPPKVSGADTGSHLDILFMYVFPVLPEFRFLWGLYLSFVAFSSRLWCSLKIVHQPPLLPQLLCLERGPLFVCHALHSPSFSYIQMKALPELSLYCPIPTSLFLQALCLSAALLLSSFGLFPCRFPKLWHTGLCISQIRRGAHHRKLCRPREEAWRPTNKGAHATVFCFYHLLSRAEIKWIFRTELWL